MFWSPDRTFHRFLAQVHRSVLTQQQQQQNSERNVTAGVLRNQIQKHTKNRNRISIHFFSLSPFVVAYLLVFCFSSHVPVVRWCRSRQFLHGFLCGKFYCRLERSKRGCLPRFADDKMCLQLRRAYPEADNCCATRWADNCCATRSSSKFPKSKFKGWLSRFPVATTGNLDNQPLNFDFGNLEEDSTEQWS